MNKKGQKVAHESLTAWDEGLSAEAFGTFDMDDEGHARSADAAD